MILTYFAIPHDGDPGPSDELAREHVMRSAGIDDETCGRSTNRHWEHQNKQPFSAFGFKGQRKLRADDGRRNGARGARGVCVVGDAPRPDNASGSVPQKTTCSSDFIVGAAIVHAPRATGSPHFVIVCGWSPSRSEEVQTLYVELDVVPPRPVQFV